MSSRHLNPATLSRPLISFSALPAQRARGAASGAVATLLATLASACSSDGVDLGGGVRQQEIARDGRCADSPIIAENVLVTNQDELAALEGCEQILGALDIRMYENADLSPLHALRAVDALTLGLSNVELSISAEEPANDGQIQAALDAEAALHGVWLTSLAGLESLQRTGSLQMYYTGVSDFEPLSALTQVASGASSIAFESGALNLGSNDALVSLAGLENARGFSSLNLTFNPALESLEGLVLDDTLSAFNVMGSPLLVNIDPLSSVTFIDYLNLEETGVTDLRALSSLEGVTSMFFLNNPALVDPSGLDHVAQCQSYMFQGNAALKTVPSFAAYTILPDLITIDSNPELESVVFDAPFAISLGPLAGGSYRSFGLDAILISNNAKLRSVSVAPSLAEEFGLKAAQVVAFERNPSLESVDFGGFQRADVLVINDNPALASVTIGELASVDSLELTGNPALDTSVFDGVLTFERIESAEPAAPPTE